jgi:hypothetical protein
MSLPEQFVHEQSTAQRTSTVVEHCDRIARNMSPLTFDAEWSVFVASQIKKGDREVPIERLLVVRHFLKVVLVFFERMYASGVVLMPYFCFPLPKDYYELWKKLLPEARAYLSGELKLDQLRDGANEFMLQCSDGVARLLGVLDAYHCARHGVPPNLSEDLPVRAATEAEIKGYIARRIAEHKRAKEILRNASPDVRQNELEQVRTTLSDSAALNIRPRVGADVEMPKLEPEAQVFVDSMHADMAAESKQQ